MTRLAPPLLVVLVALSGCAPPAALFPPPAQGEPAARVGREVAVTRAKVHAGRPSMGTVLELTLVVADPERGKRAAEALFAQAHDLERIFTTYNPSSALNRLSAAAGRGPQPVDPRLARILGESASYQRETRGAFDVTVGPLVDLWVGAAERDRPPSDAEIAAVLLRVGSEGLHISSLGPTVELERPGMRLDLGAIAKGWALDRMAELLVQGRIRDALLDFGQSSILALGRPLDAPAWTVGLRGLDGDLAGLVTLRNAGFAVSGTLGRFSEIGGVRYGHVIDPRNGRALTRNVQAAVVAPTATAAEAWSTALAVLGPEGLAWVEEEPGVEAHLLLEDGSAHVSSGWNAAVAFEPAP